MDNQRLILFIALSVIILLLWQAWERERVPAVPPAPPHEIPAAPSASAPPAAGVPVARPVTAPLESGERITVVTDLLQAEIDTTGADLRSLLLRKHPVAVDQPDHPFHLMSDTASELFITQTGLIGHNGMLPNHKSRYRAAAKRYQLGAGQDSVSVDLVWADAGLRVTKTYTFHRNSYVIDLRYDIRNDGKRERDAYLYSQFLRATTEQGGLLRPVPSYTGGVIYSPEKKYEKISFDDMRAKALQREVAGGWVAMLQHYFVGAWLPPDDATYVFYSDTQAGGRFVFGYKSLVPARIAPGQSTQLVTHLYAGPKEQSRLAKLKEGMTLTVDYGWLTFIAAPLFWLLQWIHTLVGNWGWAIIILTILIKALFHPLSLASYRSMAHMRRVQPKMASIKERYGNDRQQMQQAMMELYKTEKINPLGGCLPILIQIPVFIALYWVLLESVEMRQAPFALWLKDLSSPDPYYVLPVLMGASMLAQQWLSPQMMDPMQRKVMMAMPVVFTVFFLFFPAGLVLYWVVQNLLSIAQQWWINRSIEAKGK